MPCHGVVDRFVGSSASRHGIELRRLTQSRGAAPVDEVVTAVGVKRELMIGEETPPFCVTGRSRRYTEFAREIMGARPYVLCTT
jgi:hypothetical protein